MGLLLTIPLSAPVGAADDDHDLVGIYESEGMNPDGNAYAGVVEIVGHNGIYFLHWMLDSGEESHGFGVVTEHLLSVTYVAGRIPGVIVYVMEPGKPLQGRWVLAGIDGIFRETLTKISSDHPIPQSAPTRPRGGSPAGARV